MTPHRNHDRGTFVLDRRCGKLGRVKIASGTTDPEEFTAINAMVSKLKRDRRWDLLGLLAQHLATPVELYDAIYRGDLASLPSADEARPLRRAVDRWLIGADLAGVTRAEYERMLHTLPEGAHVGDLAGSLRERRAGAVQNGKRAAFNRLLMAARAFVRDMLGPTHRLAAALREIQPLSETPRRGNPQEPDQIRALCLKLPRVADMIWALCLSGMRRGEYWRPGGWELTTDRLIVHGTKSQAARRPVPLAYRLAAPTVGYSAFYHALTGGTDGLLNVHDLRKTHQRWLEDAGVPDWRIKLYAGHRGAGKDLATIYRRPRDLTRLLREDAERFREWLGEPPKPAIQAMEG